MKRIGLSGILLFYSVVLFAQNFEDGFTDGDFTSSPVWSGTESSFIIDNLEGNPVLRLNGSQADTSFLSTSSGSVSGYWDFFIQIDGSAPSNTNRAEIFLMSDIADLKGAVNGYAVRIGETGDDVFSIVRYENGKQEATVLSDTTVFESGGSYRVRVTRNTNGEWNIQVGQGYFGTLNNTGNTAMDNTFTTASYFGVRVIYTSSRTDDYYFDFKIEEPPVVIEPFFVEYQTLIDDNSLDLTFNRDVDPQPDTNQFVLNGTENPQTVSLLSNNIYRLNFEESFPGGENQLEITGVQSSNADTSLSDTLITFFRYDEFEDGDILINEFLKDPPPGSDLPEYIELINISGKYLNLRNWQVGDNNSIKTITESDLTMLPDSFLVLTSSPESLISSFGVGEYIDVSLPTLNNSADQIRLFSQDGKTVDSLAYDSDWGGVDVALERRTTNAPSILISNWGDSPDEIGTPGRPNDIKPDTTAPEIESYTLVNDSTFLVIFSEAVKVGPAENPDNYEIAIPVKQNPLATSAENDFLKVTFFEPDTILLEFKRPYYTSEFANSVIILNQEDVFGNVAESLQFDYRLEYSEPALPGDIVINEFMYDPAPGYTEFVEIYNHTTKNINLKGWTISDNTGNYRELTNENFYIHTYGVGSGLGNEFLIIVPDNTMPDFGETRIVLGNDFPTLNNTTDAIVLKNADGVTIDSLTYFNDWGGEEVSLERRTTGVSGIYRANWGDSPSPEYATPAQRNQIEADTTAPEIMAAVALDSLKICLTFTEEPMLSIAADITNYSAGRYDISEVTAGEDSVLITLINPLKSGEEIEIIVRNQQDIFGNVRESDSVSVTYFAISEAGSGEVVINEILYRRANEDAPEFVELYNRTNQNFDVTGWSLTDEAGNRAFIETNAVLPGNEYLVLTDNTIFAQSGDNYVYLRNFPSLNDRGDAVAIKNREGELIDSLFYSDVWGGDDPGISLERKDPAGASADGSNWGTNSSGEGNSAGKVSSIYEPDTTPPEIIFAAERNGYIFVQFSEFVNFDPDSRFIIQSLWTNVLEYDSLNANYVILEYPADIDNNDLSEFGYEVRILDVTDVAGNTADALVSNIAKPLKPGTVIINEIMFDPLANADDNLPDQTEYIELFNPTETAISLEGIYLHDAEDENNEVRIIEPLSSQYKWIDSESYFLIYAEDDATSFPASRIAQYFDQFIINEKFTARVDRSSLSLASSGDAIFLADSSGLTMDSVFYDETWHNPNLFDTDGISLERINPLGASNDETNWGSNILVPGGSPNERNSIYQIPGAAPDKTGLTFSSNPFSPDGDGFEDQLMIGYKLDAADYLLRVRIFDRFGREVRKLADGYPAGFEGYLSWDGLTDSGKRNRVGIYIILFEAYDSTSGKDITFKETAVLARKF